MKKIITLCLVSIALLTGCEKESGKVNKVEKLDLNKASVDLMNMLRPKLLTVWKIKELHVSPYPPYTSEIGIFKDSVIYNLGELSINQINSTGFYEARNDVNALLSYKTKSYPVGFRMGAIPEHLVNNKGSQVFIFLEYRFPLGTHVVEPEEDYLAKLTLINNNFEIELSENGEVMLWKGLRRGITSIRFEKSK